MRTFEIQQFGLEHLKLVKADEPRPARFEVLVRMTAASINYRDLMVAKGVYNPKLKLPMVPLSDGAGVVEEVGPDVTRVKKGDRVAACFMQRWIDGPPTKEKAASALGGAISGVLREYALFHEDGLVHAPDSLTDIETAALPCAAVTAWHALFEHTRAIPGDNILIQGTGGVSTFGLLFARAAGLRTIVLSSTDEKLARVRELGADETINYKQNAEWDMEARSLTAGVGVDNVIEVGGSDTLPKSVRAVRVHGVISVIGVLTGRGDPAVGPGSLLMNSLRVQGIYVGSREMFERMNRAIEFHRLKPVIDRVFEWTELPEALRHMESQRHFGKICLAFS